MKIKLIAIISAAVLLLGGGGAIALGVHSHNNLPENVVLNSLVGLIEDITQREEIAPVFSALERGSVQFDVAETYLNSGADIVSMSGKLYFSKDKFALQNFKYETDKNSSHSLKIAGDIYVTDDFLYLNETEHLGGAYGIELENLAEELKKSIFAYGSNSKYAISDEELFDSLVRAYENPSSDRMARDMEKIVEKYLKQAWRIFADNVEFEEGETAKVLDSGIQKVYRVITIRLTPEDITDMVEDLYEFMKEDDSIPRFLNRYEEKLCYTIEAEEDTESLPKAYDDFLVKFGEELEAIKSRIRKLDLFRQVDIEITTPGASSTLINLSVSVSKRFQDKPDTFFIDFGTKGFLETDRFSIGGTLIGGELSYEITENSEERYIASGELTYRKDGKVQTEEILTLEIVDRNKAMPRYTFNLGTEEEYIEISGECVRNQGGIYINVLQVIKRKVHNNRAYVSKYFPGIYLGFNEWDKFPEKPDIYKRPSEITDEYVDMWVDFAEMLNEDYFRIK